MCCCFFISLFAIQLIIYILLFDIIEIEKVLRFYRSYIYIFAFKIYICFKLYKKKE